MAFVRLGAPDTYLVSEKTTGILRFIDCDFPALVCQITHEFSGYIYYTQSTFVVCLVKHIIFDPEVMCS